MMASSKYPAGMYGVLVDVSGSMRSAYALDRSQRVDVERTHAILTTIISIVRKEVDHHKRQDSIFVGAFGLSGKPETCDLLRLLEITDINNDFDGRQSLVNLAKEHRAPHATEWISHLSECEAQTLYRVLSSDPDLISTLIDLIPWRITRGVGSIVSSLGLKSKKEMFHDSDAYKHAKHLIGKQHYLLSMQHPKPRPVQEVSEMLSELLPSDHSHTSLSKAEPSLHDKIQKRIEQIEPYIFGGTPMKRSLTDAKANFINIDARLKRVLFILSDGESGDGDPRPIASELRDIGVTIVTCYLTSDHIQNPKCLLDSSQSFKDEGRKNLFEMSSAMQNTHTPISYLVDAGWELPSSGESRLFIQANSLDVVNEFCEVVVSQLTKTCDALVHVLHKVPLATYINQTNADFEPQSQVGGTCYANAIAAVFHLAMHRIVSREGGVPNFYDIRDRIIQEYGEKGANTEKVLKRVCPEYRLRYCKVNEVGARKAINERRPVVARFSWYSEERKKFQAFFEHNARSILNKADIVTDVHNKLGGHAVILIRSDPNCLTFMNSWGQKWGDGGFFRMKDEKVLSDTTFFDVYWKKEDLLPNEIEAYTKECTERAKELLHTFPSIQDLPHKCPKCNHDSKVGEYCGHILEAECPKCHQKFKPTNEEILQSLYSRNFD